jgi:hypothetical protein
MTLRSLAPTTPSSVFILALAIVCRFEFFISFVFFSLLVPSVDRREMVEPHLHLQLGIESLRMSKEDVFSHTYTHRQYKTEN